MRFLAFTMLWTIALPIVLADGAEILERGRRDAARFHDGKLAPLHEDFDETVKAALTLEALRMFRAQIGEQLGAEADLLDEAVLEQGAISVYRRVATYEKYDGPIELLLSYRSGGLIAGFLIRPQQTEAASDHLDYDTKTTLRLPFEGEWYVYWGGRSIDENYHTAYPDQRFAYDILVMKGGKSHRGDGTKNEQYHAWGRKVLAPAAGTVVSAANDVVDNVPGEMNPKQPLGNHVILDHGNGEYSFLAHLQRGSVTVAEGDTVEAGQLLGLCGNSGNTTEAHIHYHLQNTPTYGEGDGLPAPFVGYVADGTPVERGEPTRGQSVAPR